MFAELRAQVSFDLLKVERFHRCSRTLVNTRLVTDDVRAEWLGEPADGLAEVSLEEFDDRGGEVERLGLFEHVFFAEVVRSHPLSEVTDHLGRGRNL